MRHAGFTRHTANATVMLPKLPATERSQTLGKTNTIRWAPSSYLNSMDELILISLYISIAQKELREAQETQIHSLSAGKVKAIVLTSFTLYPRLIHAILLIPCQLSLVGTLFKIKKSNWKADSEGKYEE